MNPWSIKRAPLALGALLLILAGLGAGARPAAAYPQWQLTSGASRCNQCHYAPGGGGLITGFGRAATGEELSTWASDGAFLHGKVELPARLQIGGDLRFAFLAKDVQEPDGATRAVFPMQADLSVRLVLHETVTAHATGGLRARTRHPGEIVPDTNFQPIHASRLISREHYLMWRLANQGPYARLGRFYAPYGLRFAEHVLYLRRDLGFNQLEETYNLSGGYVTDAWEAHLTFFAPDFVRQIGSEEGGVAASYEHRLFDDRAAVGLQGRYAAGRGVNRLMGGLVAKYHLPALKTLLLAEGNLVRFDVDLLRERSQFVGAAGFALLPVRGLMLTLLGERNQEDLKVRGAVWNAATALVSWFPVAHLEIGAMARLQFPGGGRMAPLFLGQVHYFL